MATERETAIQQMLDLIETGDAHISESIAYFQQANNRRPNLTHDQIVEIMAAAPDDDPDWYVENMEAMEEGKWEWPGTELEGQEGSEDEPESPEHVASSESIRHNQEIAQRLADKLSADTELQEEIEATFVARLRVKNASLIAYMHMKRVLGDDMDLLPIPGSQEGKTGNKPFDTYRAKKDDKSVPMSFYGDLANDTKTGKDTDLVLRHIAGSQTNAESQDFLRKNFDWSNLSQADKNSLKDTYAKRKLNLRQSYRNGAQIHFKLEEIRSNFEKDQVNVAFMVSKVNGKETLRSVTKPVRIFRPTDASSSEMSVGTFLKVNVKTALTNVAKGTDAYIAVVESVVGAPKPPKSDGVDAITSPEQAVSAFGQLAGYANPDGKDDVTVRVKEVARVLGGKDTDAEILSTFDTYVMLDNLWSNYPELKARYIALDKARNKKAA